MRATQQALPKSGLGDGDPAASVPDARGLQLFLAGSWLAMAAQSMLTTYPNDSSSTGLVWLLIDSALVWGIYRRASYAAWAISGTLALTAAFVYGALIFQGPRQVAMFALCLAQVLPLWTPTVRRHLARRTTR